MYMQNVHALHMQLAAWWAYTYIGIIHIAGPPHMHLGKKTVESIRRIAPHT